MPKPVEKKVHSLLTKFDSKSYLVADAKKKLANGNHDKAERSLQSCIKRAHTRDPSLAVAHYMLGILQCSQGRYNEAEIHFEAACQWYQKYHAERARSEKAVQARYQVGESKFKQNHFAAARGIFEEIVEQETEGTNTCLKTQHEARFMIGMTYYGAERFGEAEGAFRDLMRTLESASEEFQRSLPRTLSLLTSSLYEQSKWEDVVSLCQKSIGMLEKQQKNHPDIANYLARSGEARFNQGMHAEASKLFRDAVYLHEKSLEPKHLESVAAKSWLGCTFDHMGQYDSAELWIRLAIAGYEKMGVSGNTALLTSKHWLGVTLLHQANREEAELILQETLNEAQQTLGTSHSVTEAVRRQLEMIRAHVLDSTMTASDNHSGTQELLSEQRLEMQETRRYTENPPTHLSQESVTSMDNQNIAEDDMHQYFTGKCETLVPYTDSQINSISRLLKHSNRLSWAKVPRTYIVLRLIGQLGKLDDLLKEGFSDYHFPVDELKLPNTLTPDLKQAFITHQNLVLNASLGIEHGEHRHYDNDKDAPFQRICILGKGGYGQIDKVQSKVNHKAYARKQVYRGKAFRGVSKEMVQMFISEIDILKRLDHRHIVELVGSYTDDRYINLLMSPVASMDLARYLRLPDVNRPELRTFYGCLAVALEYLHTQKIRHKDLKPQNILVDSGTILLTDFGLSLDFTDASGSTTFGMVPPCSRKYAAPEVLSGDMRNLSADIWSLGTVYLEMSVVLKGLGMQRLKSLYDQHDSWQYFAQRHPDEFQKFFIEVEGTGDSRDNVALEWCKEMLSVKQDDRPSASTLVEKIMKASSDGEMGFCGICCEAEEHEL